MGRDFITNFYFGGIFFISTHTPRVGRDSGVKIRCRAIVKISTHTPRVGRDRRQYQLPLIRQISTHTPRVGRDCKPPLWKMVRKSFQLTRPVWGVTLQKCLLIKILVFQLTRPVWGVTGQVMVYQPKFYYISTHTPRVGRDNADFKAFGAFINFNSHAPCGA